MTSPGDQLTSAEWLKRKAQAAPNEVASSNSLRHRIVRGCSLLLVCFGLGAVDASESSSMSENKPSVIVESKHEPIAPGKFQPTWESLKQYSVPEWFRDAKFGIWAHWGPQCQPEAGDWYARHMYEEDSPQYPVHLQKYGHPSKAGFKEVIHEWRAEKWEPEKLVELYQKTGAQYFFAMANHHDNFDLWQSKYQPWNSTRVGPEKDLIAGWAKAAGSQGLRFGVSVHAAHAWSWYEAAQLADKTGPLVGVPYDGRLTRADGGGQWWNGFEPQDLYEQRHQPSAGSENPNQLFRQWEWGNGASLPDVAYCEKFYDRVVDLINQHHPDLIYFDDTVLPLWPVSDAGLKITAHFYNSNMQRHGGKLEAVIFGKILTPEQRQCLVWDVERGASNQIEPIPWQTDTCLGDWHYNRSIYNRNQYKSAKTVIHTLADVVSKNGNLLLNVPVRGDGSIDDKEEQVLEGIAAWMEVNRESIIGTRPWKVFGEGPATAGAPISAQGFNEGKGKATTVEDVRFTTKGDALYAIVLGRPAANVKIHSLGKSVGLFAGTIRRMELLGSAEEIAGEQTDDALILPPPTERLSEIAVVYKISGLKAEP
jgi:alpha-L-fucosidase